ncbi:transmembrane protein 41A-like [Biomphalaria glabrata]|uniref:Transmembrane protein 41A-like n=2 Tax=Biomphalaria glabrata TaxID=6526 RepID=A0A9W2Z5I8_BIOGL|nr:transmembrane protein 41A-like [Biomphalaria glabrata]XP_055870279.1 transmembrane protein 41A-like [Biomphalaria glabrata]KAI8738822.1 transmembrane protein 41A [Biomphalaria glabrata]
MPRRAPSRAGVTGGSIYSILWIPVIFCAATLTLYLLAKGITYEEDGEKFELKFPTSVDDVSEMGTFLKKMKSKHLNYLLFVYCFGYIYKQTFAIPGSVFMNLLAGVLFGPYLGFVLASTLTAIGATFCFLLSGNFAKPFVMRYFRDKVHMFQQKVQRNRDSLFFFLLFIRLFPMSPNWFINISSPIVGIPIHLFFTSVFIGLMPYNFVCVQTGSVLSEIHSMNEIFTLWTLFKMMGIAVIALLPGLAIRWFNIKIN